MTLCADYKVLVDAVGSSSNHLNIFDEGYETFMHHWVSLLVAQHPISCAERVPKSG